MADAVLGITAQKSPGGKRVIDRLKEIKGLSDECRYPAKHAKAVALITKDPSKFIIDSEGGSIVGLTHKSTGFRFHLPRQVLTGITLERQEETPELLAMKITNGKTKKAELLVEFVESSAAQHKGLGGRPTMPDNFGMLFKTATSFWMKDCNFDLDAAFLDADGRILDIQHMSKESYPKPFYAVVPGIVKHAIELPSRWCAAHGIQHGDVLKLVN